MPKTSGGILECPLCAYSLGIVTRCFNEANLEVVIKCPKCKDYFIASRMQVGRGLGHYYTARAPEPKEIYNLAVEGLQFDWMPLARMPVKDLGIYVDLWKKGVAQRSSIIKKNGRIVEVYRSAAMHPGVIPCTQCNLVDASNNTSQVDLFAWCQFCDGQQKGFEF